MFYFAFRGDALLELLLPGLMRRFTFQIGPAILSVLLVCLVIPRGAAAQDVATGRCHEPNARCDCAGQLPHQRRKPARPLRPRLPLRQPNPNPATC